MLGLAKAHKARILHASTSEIYGDPIKHPQPESYWGNVNTVGIRSCYDEGKRAAETICADYARFKHVDARLFRIFNTYGEYMHPDDGRVISNFCVAALKGESVPIYGDGSQTRHFATPLILSQALLRWQEPRAQYDGPDLGNPVEFTISELVGVLEKVMGKKLKTTEPSLTSERSESSAARH